MAFKKQILDSSGSITLRPVTQFQILLNLASFIAVFLGFHGTILGLSEGVFGVANDFTDGVKEFAHIKDTFRRMRTKLVGCQGEA